MTLDEIEKTLRHRLEALPPAVRAELVHVHRLPDFDRVERIVRSGAILRRGSSASC